MKVIFEVEDNTENGTIRVKVTPSVAELAVKAHNQGLTSAEALAMHLARKAVEYHMKEQQKASPIILDTKGIGVI